MLAYKYHVFYNFCVNNNFCIKIPYLW